MYKYLVKFAVEWKPPVYCSAQCSLHCACIPQRGNMIDTSTASDLFLEVFFSCNVHVFRIVNYRYRIPVH